MAEHTPEPWRTDASGFYYKLYGPREGELLALVRAVPNEVAAANARRIVACVNACAGMATEDVEIVARNGGFKALLEEKA